MTSHTTALAAQTGTLAVDGGNIFTILKESLYEESDIVFRELVANAADAIAKRRAAGADIAGTVVVGVDPEAGTITVEDDGIGMDRDEVDRYINQIALSGTQQFVAENQGEAVTVGHFGVGFYSAFMLADTVEIHSRPASGAPAVRWTGKADMTWRIDAGERAATGTAVVLRAGPESPYLADPQRVVAALEKYFPFPHVTILVRGPGLEAVVGDASPVWRRPAELVADEEMRAFYRAHFDEPADPVGWVRVESVDLGLRGVVFYRDTAGGAEAIDGRASVLSRGVRIEAPAGMIPKFVGLQHLVLECDRLPLVVSRAQVRSGSGDDDVPALVSECLSQELAIALHEVFTGDRARYEAQWDELAPFVKYGVLTDRVFASVMTRKVLFTTLTGQRVTVGEYLDRVTERFTGTVFYTSDPVGQAPYVSAFCSAGIPALVLDHVIDSAMMQRLELVTKDIVFMRLDADVARVLAAESQAESQADDQAAAARVVALFEEVAQRRLPQATVTALRLLAPELSVLLTVDEVQRRMDELRQMNSLVTGRLGDGPTAPRTLLVNLASPLVGGLAGADPARAALVAEHLVDLALLGQDELTSDDLLAFLARSEDLLAGHLRAPAPTPASAPASAEQE